MKFVGPLTSGIAGRHCILLSGLLNKKCTVKPRYTGPKNNGNPAITNAKP